ncbi:MAG: aminotransferase class III-fold pyridoxal phosphate-dependent enzyme [Verrucomicrobiota bacterium]
MSSASALYSIPSRLRLTFQRMLKSSEPNFFRLYHNPHVIEAAFFLDRLSQGFEHEDSELPTRQTFIANSSLEALSGAIKLCRYYQNENGNSPSGVILDRSGRFPFVAEIPVEGGNISLIPDVDTVCSVQSCLERNTASGFIVLSAEDFRQFGPDEQKILADYLKEQSCLIVLLVQRSTFENADHPAKEFLLGNGFVPDIILFDESFIHREVPFGAFCAQRDIYNAWNAPGLYLFHSSTYQPNTITSSHLVACIREDFPDLVAKYQPFLDEIIDDPQKRFSFFERLYSPFFAKVTRLLGFQAARLTAEDLVVRIHQKGGRTRDVLDFVSGVACSIRGHNPKTYLDEVEMLALGGEEPEELLVRLTSERTGLPHLLPGVSGASAVENAQRLALTAQYPRKKILILKKGFAGKTLLAVVANAKESYRKHLQPVYSDVFCCDPWADDSLSEVEALLQSHDFAMVHVELINGEAGVYPVPDHVLEFLSQNKKKYGYLLFIDEIQTGVYRVGPFSLARKKGLDPDLLALGKSTCDMMYPFSMALFSDKVYDAVQQKNVDLIPELKKQQAYPMGYLTAANVIRWCEKNEIPSRVEKRGQFFAQQLYETIAKLDLVKEIRVHGLLIAVEMNVSQYNQKWMKKLVPRLIFINLVGHASKAILVNYNANNPATFKITPPLAVKEEELNVCCEALHEVMTSHWLVLLWGAIKMKLRRNG